ncbi:MAG TPA: dihydrodipicolinate synthase family protein [Ktedonobacteraceae bacterium]
MSLSIRLPAADGSRRDYQLGAPGAFAPIGGAPRSRIAYAAAHVVCDPLTTTSHEAYATLDWDATMAYRRHLWSCGLGIAEAMDTSQRGMGLSWSLASKLIRLSLAEARSVPGARIACGAGTDHLIFDASTTLDDIAGAYEEQCGFIEEHGGQIIVMASRALAARARTADDYLRVYNRILSQVKQPVILHWLGDMFDPALYGYWGSDDVETAMQTCLEIIQQHEPKVDGIKISLLDRERECVMRRLLPESVRMYTGDDFHYPEMVQGDEQGYSHALLGIFDAIAPAAATALHALDAGDLERYNTILAPTLPLSRHIFQTPTFYYKVGVVFMAYLNGHQAHFRLVGGLENGRSLLHLVELFKLADQAGLLRDPELALERMRHVLAVGGYV